LRRVVFLHQAHLFPEIRPARHRRAHPFKTLEITAKTKNPKRKTPESCSGVESRSHRSSHLGVKYRSSTERMLQLPFLSCASMCFMVFIRSASSRNVPRVGEKNSTSSPRVKRSMHMRVILNGVMTNIASPGLPSPRAISPCATWLFSHLQRRHRRVMRRLQNTAHIPSPVPSSRRVQQSAQPHPEPLPRLTNSSFQKISAILQNTIKTRTLTFGF